MDRNFQIASVRLLAVEGKDECNFFDALLKFEQITDVQTVDIGGKDKFPIELPLLRNSEGFNKVTTLGFVRDAETNQAQSAFDSICDTLKKLKLPYPHKMNDIQPGPPKISVFIMPRFSEILIEEKAWSAQNQRVHHAQ